MEDKQFSLIITMITELAYDYDLVHSNGRFVHMVNKYNYNVSFVDLLTVNRIEMDLDQSLSYLQACGDERQDKWSFIKGMEAFICSTAGNTDDYTYDMRNLDIDDALNAASNGLVYHWNGAQLFVQDNKCRVIVYDFVNRKVTMMTAANSWVYQRSNHVSNVEVESVRYAATGVWSR